MCVKCVLNHCPIITKRDKFTNFKHCWVRRNNHSIVSLVHLISFCLIWNISLVTSNNGWKRYAFLLHLTRWYDIQSNQLIAFYSADCGHIISEWGHFSNEVSSRTSWNELRSKICNSVYRACIRSVVSFKTFSFQKFSENLSKMKTISVVLGAFAFTACVSFYRFFVKYLFCFYYPFSREFVRFSYFIKI